jgi:surfeit locus 1 family protein
MARRGVSMEADRKARVRRLFLFGMVIVLAAGAASLGVWQLRRLTARRAINRAALAARELPPLVAAGTGPAQLLPNRRAILSGDLDEAHEFVLRDRMVRGVPAVLIVTPLRPTGTDTALLVNRGYVPAPDAVDPGAAKWSEQATRRFYGILLPMPDRGDGAPLVHRGRETWHSLDLSAMRTRLPYPLAPVYLIAESDSVEGTSHTIRGTVYPFRAEPPSMDEGPHLMYAIQWFGIGAAVAAFGWLFIWRGKAKGRDLLRGPC